MRRSYATIIKNFTSRYVITVHVFSKLRVVFTGTARLIMPDRQGFLKNLIIPQKPTLTVLNFSHRPLTILSTVLLSFIIGFNYI